MISSLLLQIKLLLHFLKSYWFLVGIGAGAIYMSTPRMEIIADKFLANVQEDALHKRDSIQITKIKRMYDTRDSLNQIAFQTFIDAAFDVQNHHLDSVAKRAVNKEFRKIISDTIPFYKNGKQDGYWLIYLMPDNTPIINMYNSIFNDPS